MAWHLRGEDRIGGRVNQPNNATDQRECLRRPTSTGSRSLSAYAGFRRKGPPPVGSGSAESNDSLP